MEATDHREVTSGEDRSAGEHFVRHCPDGIDVGPVIHVWIRRRLLRRHVGRCPQREARRSHGG